MARVRQRGSGWNVEIRRTGAPRVCKTFRTKEEAEIWAKAQEEAVLERRHMQPQRQVIAEHQIMRASAGDVVCAAVPFPEGGGVYILVNGSRIVYAGKAANVISRILQHRKNGRQFTHFVFVPCAPEDMDRIEREVIKRFVPSQNRQHVPRQSPNATGSHASA